MESKMADQPHSRSEIGLWERSWWRTFWNKWRHFSVVWRHRSLVIGSNVNISGALHRVLWSLQQGHYRLGFDPSWVHEQKLKNPGKFSACTNPIIHLFYLPKICKGIVLDYSWDMFMSQEKLQTMSMQNIWGVKEVHYGIVQVVTTRILSYKTS